MACKGNLTTGFASPRVRAGCFHRATGLVCEVHVAPISPLLALIRLLGMSPSGVRLPQTCVCISHTALVQRKVRCW